MKVLFFGLGSIAGKHIQALKKCVATVEIYAYRSSRPASIEDGVTNVYELNEDQQFDCYFITNPTFLHLEVLKMVIDKNKPILLEKPPFHLLQNEEETFVKSNESLLMNVYSAFNLRFLDSLIYLKANIDKKKIQEVTIYCGSFLPEWRKNANYKDLYSASAAKGGGVHLDLIHELDYAIWLFGKPQKVQSIKKSASALNIESVDYAMYNLDYDTYSINITLNYYRKKAKRSIEIVGNDFVYYADLLNNQIMDLVTDEIIYKSEQRILDTYTNQIKYFCNSMEGGYGNSFIDSIQVLKLALS